MRILYSKRQPFSRRLQQAYTILSRPGFSSAGSLAGQTTTELLQLHNQNLYQKAEDYEI